MASLAKPPTGHDWEELTLFPVAPSPARRIVHARWDAAADAVYIGRPGPYGNPFPLANAADPVARAEVLERYQAWFDERIGLDQAFRARIEALRGQTLACWCPTRADPWRPCHGDVILAWLDANPPT